MNTLTFEQLPQAVGQLYDKLDKIEQLILNNNNPQAPQDERMNIAQAAEFLGLAIATIYGKVSRREIPVNKRGKHLYFYKSELEAWIRSGRKKTTDEIEEDLQLPLATKRRSFQP